MAGVDERPDVRLGVERVSDAQATGRLGEPGHDLVVHRGLDQEARAGLAALAGRVVDRPDRGGDRLVEVRVGEDDARALAAQLQRDPLDRVGAQAHDLAAGRRRAGERDLLNSGMRDEVAPDGRPIRRQDVDDAGREPDLDGELGEPERRERRSRIGLEDGGAAGRERGRQLPRRHHQRVVPRHDLGAHTDRLLERVVGERAAERARAARRRCRHRRVEPERLDRRGELGLDRADRLSDVSGLEGRELRPAGPDPIRQRVQEARPLGRGGPRPIAAQSRAGRLDSGVDVRLARERHVRQGLAGRGLGQGEGAAGAGAGLAADVDAGLDHAASKIAACPCPTPTHSIAIP